MNPELNPDVLQMIQALKGDSTGSGLGPQPGAPGMDSALGQQQLQQGMGGIPMSQALMSMMNQPPPQTDMGYY